MTIKRRYERKIQGEYPFSEHCSPESLAALQRFVNDYEERRATNRRRMKIPAQRRVVDITAEMG